MLLTVLAVSALTGCGSKAPTAQDAQNYAKAVLDLMCTGDYDHSVKLADVEEGKELEMRDQMIDDTIASLAGENGLSEEVQAEFKEVFVEAFSKCKYTVGSAAPDEQGEFDVSISIEPLKLFAGMEEKLDAQISSAFVIDRRIQQQGVLSYGQADEGKPANSFLRCTRRGRRALRSSG